MSSQPFSFVWLEERVVEYTQDTDDKVAGRFELYAMACVIAIGIVAVAIYLILRNPLGQRIMQISVLLEWACVVLVYIRAAYQASRAYKRQYTDFAKDLDDFYVRYRRVIEALRTYPAAELARHLRYIRDRKTTLVYRHTLLSGGLEKIGILPLLALMYLQLKDWSFGEWKHLLDQVHLIGGVLLLLLLCTYLVAWWGVRAKGRLDVYEALLTEAGMVEVEVSSD